MERSESAGGLSQAGQSRGESPLSPLVLCIECQGHERALGKNFKVPELQGGERDVERSESAGGLSQAGQSLGESPPLPSGSPERVPGAREGLGAE